MMKNILKAGLFVTSVLLSNIAWSQCPTITCPGNITVNKDPGICGAVVNFTAPVGTDPCLPGPQTVTFNHTGAAQTWTVPLGVTSINVSVVGAGGGNSIAGSSTQSHLAGSGGRVQATVPVTPGQTLNIYVGGKGANADGSNPGNGGFNGGGNGATTGYYKGGGGGGASDIRIGGTALSNRVIVAGGGGGAASNYSSGDNGGTGGGTSAGNGMSNFNLNDVSTGKGGTQSAGGAGGQWSGYNAGTAGTSGIGGTGGSGTSGGGGGGGYYGGGGGSWAGGGGGSSYTGTGLTSVTHTQGFQANNGQVVITYTPAAYTVQTSGLLSGATFPIGTTTQSYTVNGGGGSTANCSFTVTVVDPGAPTILTQPTPSVTICAGNTINLSATSTNATAYQWKKNGVALSNGSNITGALSANLIVTGALVTDSGSYTLDITGVAGCSVKPTNASVVVVNPSPKSVMDNSSHVVCDGSTTYLPVTLTGTPPFTLTYSNGMNSYTQTGIMTNNYQMPVVALTGTNTYTITSLSHANGCTAVNNYMTGNAVITSNVRPTGVITGSPTICNGNLATLQVGFSGTPPYSFTYGDGGSFNYTVSNIYNNPYTLVVAPTGTVTYALTDVTDVNCSTMPVDLSGSSLVTVNQRPTATLSGTGQTICHDDQVNLSVSFTGTPPYNFGYTNGISSQLVSGINSPTYNFTVTPEATGTYQVTGLSDLNCVAQLSDLNGQIPVTVRHPEATISGSQVSCEGGTSPIVVDFSGAGLTAPYTFTYNDGSANTTVTTSTNPYQMTVNNVASTTYSLVSFNDANCQGDLNGSAVLTVNPAGGWRGMVSSDWHNAANWCGVVPTATTEVLIPGTSPNMPVLASGAGYCDTVVVMPGASITVNSGANLNIFGNLDNNGTLNWSNGHINFKGTAAQYVDGFTAQNVFIDNMTGVYAKEDIVTNSLLILNGNLYLDSSNLILAPGATTIGQAFNKYVHTNGTGVMRIDVSTGPVLFPVGNTAYNPVTLTNAGIPDKFNVRVVDNVYMDGYGVSPETVDFPVVGRTWMIEEQIPGGSNVTIKAQWNAGEEWNFFDRQHAFIRHWDGTEWHYNDSITAGPSQGNIPYYIVEGGFTSFSPFTVGGWSLYPLAVNLVDFTATLSGANDAMLNWEVTQSSDAQLFEIERSTDGENYTKVGEVKAQQDKTGYSTLDRGLAAGRNYYRLRMTDMSGRTGYSNVAVVITKGGGVEVVTLAPNPVTGTGVAMISSDEAVSAEVSIMDAVGHVLYKGSHELTSGLNKVSLDMNQLAPGNYTLHVLTSNGHATPVKFTKL